MHVHCIETLNTQQIFLLTKIVQLLLKHGADITLRNYENQTAVEVASAGIRTILLDSVERSTESFHRLLLQAAWQGNIKVLRRLLVCILWEIKIINHHKSYKFIISSHVNLTNQVHPLAQVVSLFSLSFLSSLSLSLLNISQSSYTMLSNGILLFSLKYFIINRTFCVMILQNLSII